MNTFDQYLSRKTLLPNVSGFDTESLSSKQLLTTNLSAKFRTKQKLNTQLNLDQIAESGADFSTDMAMANEVVGDNPFV